MITVLLLDNDETEPNMSSPQGTNELGWQEYYNQVEEQPSQLEGCIDVQAHLA